MGESVGQRDGRSPWLGTTSTSRKPRRSRWARTSRATFSGVRSGTRRKSIFALAIAGRTVFEPVPVYPDTMPHIVHVTDKVRDPVDAQHAGLVERHALELRELGRAGIAHLIHEAVDRDLVALVLQRRERPDQTP